jgi:hypothetical protein
MDTTSVFPILLFILLLTDFTLLHPPSLVFVCDFVSREDFCANEPGLKISCRKAVGRLSKSLEPNNAIDTDAIDEGQNARQDLNAELRDQKRAVVDIDLQYARFVMGRRESLVRVSLCAVRR